MNEVEKLMQNANIKQDRMCEWTCKGNEFCSTNCEHYESTQLYYPPFTAEKQLELIKWLIQKYKEIVVERKLYLYYINIRDIYTGMVHIEFDETVAGLINNLWQDLTEEERKQIRNILE